MILHALLIAAFAARFDLSFVEPQSALQPCARGVLETNAIPVSGSSDLDVIRAAGTWFSGSVRADRGPLTFVLSGDGRELWNSGTLQAGESRRFDVCADGCGIVTYSTRGEGAGEWRELECLYARGEGIRPLGERPAATYRESVYDGNPPWEDPRRFAENRERPHAMRHLHCAKENILKLDGDWKIKWMKSPDLTPPDFFSSAYDDSGWGTIRLPETCETAGYGTPLFTNFGYYWTVDPPFVSRPAPDGWLVSREPNGTSLFRRRFDVPAGWKDRRTFLRFDGFLSAIEVWVNGRRVGYAQDGRQGAEFEITDFLVTAQGGHDGEDAVATQAGHDGGDAVATQAGHDGEDAVATQNLLAVRVLRICDGSYLEDQDYWRMSGLFRPVYLESRPKAHIRDFFVRTVRASTEEPYVGGKWNLTVDVDVEKEVKVKGEGEQRMELSLFDDRHEKIGNLHCSPSPTTFTLSLVPRLWSAEEPNLYELALTLKDGQGRVLETLTRSVGFREVERRGCQMLVNGQPVMIKGVNRHEFDPDHGFALSDEQALEDLRMLKRYNVNAIRLCHYPANPSFYEMANRLGFYVMDEANCESHGLFTSDGLAGWMAKRNPLVHNYAAARNPAVDPRYRAQILDRVMGMVERDKNEPCVISWSLGNEQICQSDYFTQAYRAIRRRDPGRLVMNQRYGEKDMRDQMYEKVTNLVLYAEGKMEGAKPVQLPFILCEYNHTQGNSGGNLVDYRDVFMKYPCLQGGFTWDFIDQGIRRKDSKGREYFAYGGDFGDAPNSGAGCLNGCFRPDRTPSPQMQEMKYCFQDVGVEKFERCFVIMNYGCFASLKKYEASWTCEDDGVVVAKGSLGRLDVAPQGSATVRLAAPESKVRYLRTWNFVFRSAETTAFCEKGFELARDQIVEEVGHSSRPFNLSTLQPTNLSTSFCPCFISALTEKSRDLKGRMLWEPKGVTLDVTNGVVSLKVPAQEKGTKDIYARVGVKFALPKKFDHVEWFGRGPGENYANRKAGAHFGRYKMPIADLVFPYEVPQESGNRRDVYELVFSAPDGEKVRLTAMGKPFAFTVSPYTDEELASGKRHVSELVEADVWTVHIDDGDMGVGGVFNGLWPESFLSVGRDYSLTFGIGEEK